MKQKMKVQDKYLLTISEASEYFSIGVKNMRRLAENHTADFTILNGNRILIIRTKCEEYLLSCLDRPGSNNQNLRIL